MKEIRPMPKNKQNIILEISDSPYLAQQAPIINSPGPIKINAIQIGFSFSCNSFPIKKPVTNKSRPINCTSNKPNCSPRFFFLAGTVFIEKNDFD